MVGSASATSNASPVGSATVSVQAQGNDLVDEGAEVLTSLTGSIAMSSPASSVDFSIPWSTSGISQSSFPGAFVDVWFSVTGIPGCVDGSSATWSDQPVDFGQMGPGSGTGSVQFTCPDGSDIVPGSLGFAVNLTANAGSDNGVAESASANFQMTGVTATITS